MEGWAVVLVSHARSWVRGRPAPEPSHHPDVPHARFRVLAVTAIVSVLFGFVALGLAGVLFPARPIPPRTGPSSTAPPASGSSAPYLSTPRELVVRPTAFVLPDTTYRVTLTDGAQLTARLGRDGAARTEVRAGEDVATVCENGPSEGPGGPARCQTLTAAPTRFTLSEVRRGR